MNSLKTLLETNPFLASVVPYVGPAVPMTLLLAFAGLAFTVGVLQIRGARSRRAAFDKGARQLASLALVLGWLLLVTSRAYIFFASEGYVPQSLVGNIVELSWGVFGFSVIAASVHFAVWKPLAKHRVAHSALALVAGANATFSVVAILGSLRLLGALELPNADQLTFGDIFSFETLPSPCLSACVLAVALVAALPASAAPLWLLWRRRRDDFGRDHYNLMFGLLAKWGFLAWLVVAVLFAADAWLSLPPVHETGLPEADMVPLLVRVLPPVLVCAAHALISREKVPARLSPLMVAAFLLSMPPAYFLFATATRFSF